MDNERSYIVAYVEEIVMDIQLTPMYPQQTIDECNNNLVLYKLCGSCNRNSYYGLRRVSGVASVYPLKKGYGLIL